MVVERVILTVEIGFLQEFLRTWYAPHFLHASDAHCEELNVEHELELERPQCSDLVTEYKELLASIGEILENMATKGADPEPTTLTETVVIDDSKPESEVEEPGPETDVELAPLQEEVSSRSIEVEELSNEILIDLPPLSTMELVPSLADMEALFFLRSPDVYDPLQIFLQEINYRRTGYL